MGTLTCYIFYRLLRLAFDKKTALTGFFLITIAPQQIMASRWALDANIAPPFLLLGFYFYCRAAKKARYLFLSAVFYALALYGYAGVWLFAAITLPAQALYFLHCRKTKTTTLTLIAASALFALLILPLLLFVLINLNILPEIKTAAFSIPKLLFYRGEEIGFDNLLPKAAQLFNILIKQNDGWLSNQIPPYGLFYLFAPVFFLIGILILKKSAAADIAKKSFSLNLCFLFQIITGLAVSVTVYAFSNRINFIYIPILTAITVGVAAAKRRPPLFTAIIALYLISFAGFYRTYFSNYNQMLSRQFAYSFSFGFKEALAEAEKRHARTKHPIRITDEPYIYAKVLFYNNISQPDYQKTVTYYNYPDPYVNAKSFLYYHFDWQTDWNNLDKQSIYIAHKNKVGHFANYTLSHHGNYIVASFPQ